MEDIKKEFEELKKDGNNSTATKDNFEKTIKQLKDFKTEHTQQGYNNAQTFTGLERIEEVKGENDDESKNIDVSRNSIYSRPSAVEEKNMNKNKMLQIKQRMATFKMKIYDKFDLKKIITYWIENSKALKAKKNDRMILTKKEEVKKPKEKEEKKIEKTETSVKYEFKKPDKDLLKIIPFCNNIFSIQKSDN